MAFTSRPAFVHSGDWDAETDTHPAMKWMAHYTNNVVDAARWDTPYSDWHTEDFTLLRADGVEITGGKDAWPAVAALYSFFTKFRHEPTYLSCVETTYGYEMIGQAWVFANLPGGNDGQAKQRDGRGQEWDVKIPGGFHFQYVKDAAKGFKLRRTEIMSDSMPVVAVLLKSGVAKPADLGL